MGRVERAGAESAIGVEGVGGQEARGGILLVQYVDDAGEKIDRLLKIFIDSSLFKYLDGNNCYNQFGKTSAIAGRQTVL